MSFAPARRSLGFYRSLAHPAQGRSARLVHYAMFSAAISTRPLNPLARPLLPYVVVADLLANMKRRHNLQHR
jgi:hypothetical protein